MRAGSGLNENYGRELLELHTLGVDGGYSQADVIDVARAFTGWTHSLFRAGTAMPISRLLLAPVGSNTPVPSAPLLQFRFDSARHDASAKRVLGHDLPAGRGEEDGEEVLDILARSPATAHFIARKLVVRFVSDDPPPALVERAAAEYLRTDGDIRAVLRTIVMSPEFRSPAVFGTKVKSPTELVLSLRRAMNAPVDTTAEMIDLLLDLKQSPFGHLSPEGWPETGGPWMNAGAISTRVDIADRVSRGELKSIPVERWSGWTLLAKKPFDEQLAGVTRLLFEGQLSATTRAALAGAQPATGDPSSDAYRAGALRELLARALSAPEFQRR